MKIEVLKPLSISLLCLSLVACSSDEGDDLDQFIKGAEKEMNTNIESLPTVQAYVPIPFNPDGTLADPFAARAAASKGGGLQPNLTRAKEPLESYPLEVLKYVGMLSKKGQMYGLVETPDKLVQQIKKGEYIGPNFGLVTEVTEDRIALKEIVRDDQTGDWVEHEAALGLVQP